MKGLLVQTCEETYPSKIWHHLRRPKEREAQYLATSRKIMNQLMRRAKRGKIRKRRRMKWIYGNSRRNGKRLARLVSSHSETDDAVYQALGQGKQSKAHREMCR
jgi:hypothetical protein